MVYASECLSYGRNINLVEQTSGITKQYLYIFMNAQHIRCSKLSLYTMKVHARQRPIGTGTMSHGTLDVEHGQMKVGFFCVVITLMCNNQKLRLDEQFNYASGDIIRQHGVVNKSNGDRTKVDTNVRANGISCKYFISDWYNNACYHQQSFVKHKLQLVKWSSEAYYQQLNLAECRSKYAKSISSSNGILGHGEQSICTWFLAHLHMRFLLDHTATEFLSWNTSFGYPTDTTLDFNPFQQSHWYQIV